jgi:hypothetical protein
MAANVAKKKQLLVWSMAMAFGKKPRKVEKPQVLILKKKTLDSIRDGHVQIRPTTKKAKDGIRLSEEHKHMFFHHAVLHVPTEMDYLIAQTIEGMGYPQEAVRVAMYEGREELRFEIFPPEEV